MGFPLQAGVKKTDKEKVPGTVVSKEGEFDSLLGHERTHPY